MQKHNHLIRDHIPISLKKRLKSMNEDVITAGYTLLDYVALLLIRCIPRYVVHLFTYRRLINIRRFVSEDVYVSIMRKIFKCNQHRISCKAKVDIWIMVFMDSMWSSDKLYEMLSMNDRFVPKVVIMNILDDETNRRTEEFIRKKGYNYIIAEDMIRYPVPDVVMYPTMYDQKNDTVNISRRRLSTLIFCIPYTFWYDVASNGLLNNCNAELLWRFYAPTRIHAQIGIETNIIGRMNMRYSGYPKMDTFLDRTNKKSDRNDKAVVIYAPGMFSCNEDNNYSAFDIVGMFMLRMAKETSSEISWIYRPHPLLGESLVRASVMSEEEYDDYVLDWKSIENCRVSIGGSYKDIFICSDAMITDAISFVSTYQYTGCPLLYIERSINKQLNEYGRLLHDVVYHSEASDLEKIDEFINRIVLGGNDFLKPTRDSFFNEHLNYVKQNGVDASTFIYNDLTGLIRKV